MNKNSIEQKEEDELAWLAEQYVLGELDEVSREALEVRFGVDQSAREALANAVALLASMKIADPSNSVVLLPQRGAASYWSVRNAWLAGVAAALLVGAFGVAQSDWSELESKRILAKAWLETQEASVEDALEPELIAAMETSPAMAEEIEAPDWLITAISLNPEGDSESQAPAAKPNAGEGA